MQIEFQSPPMAGPAVPAGHQPEGGKLVSMRVDDGALLEIELAQRWPAPGGRLDQIFHHAMFPTGKLLRPLLCMESAAAVGEDPRGVLTAAASAEFGHVASLIHDDVIDGDNLRRGRASVAHEFGVDDAIVAGDALIFAMFRSLGACAEVGVSAEKIVAVLRVVAEAGTATCRGQIVEAILSHTLSCDVDTYMDMIRSKTAASFSSACQVGAILAGGTADDVSALGTYGEEVGLAFQICDDLLPYADTETTTGKPATSDLRNRRPTIAVLLTYQALPTREREQMERLFAADTDQPAAWEELKILVCKSGVVEPAREIARIHVSRAESALTALRPSLSRDRLARFAQFAVERSS